MSNRKAARAQSRPAVIRARDSKQADLVPVIEKLTDLIDVLARKLEKS